MTNLTHFRLIVIDFVTSVFGAVMPRIEHSMFIRCIIAAVIAVASRSPTSRAKLSLMVLNLFLNLSVHLC